MANEEEANLQYPLDSNSYRILDEIGSGVSAIVYKAECLPVNSTLVAIKAIDLDQSRADFDNVRREAKTMSLLSHPNILRAHCSFTVDRRLWVVMPFMSAGSLQSIITSSFPDGLSEPCIAIVLKETLNALSYLHDQGHLHRDIKAGNILIDSNGSVKLADFGVSASIFESNSSHFWSCSSSMMLTDVAGTPYWMAPEVIHSHTGYSFKADIWSFGITALELAHGRPPLSHLPPSKSLIMKITKRFRFSDYEKNKKEKHKKFSKSFMDMVKLCLDQDPSKRPTAEKLLKHSFFKSCRSSEFLVRNVLNGLPSVEARFKESKLRRLASMNKSSETEEDDDEGCSVGQNIKQRRISGWNFNEDGFELDPVFPTETEGEDSVVKQVRFGGESIIKDREDEAGRDSGESNLSSPAGVVGETQVSGDTSEGHGGGGYVDSEVMIGSLMVLKRSLDDQRQQVMDLIGLLHGEEGGGGGEVSREEQLVQVIERMKMESENEKRRNFELEMEMEFLKIQISGASSGEPSSSGGAD
ncbi:hypothetical protein L1049_016491 [Liquidambar formosana]|uniref:Protein kinase domain-containing protein n=1 Tax=Liquidambar formosana TaxID=63359 RepID=A0AAP0RZH8_LIQFO